MRPVIKKAGNGTEPVLDTKSTATVSATSVSAAQGDSLPRHTTAAYSTVSAILTPVVCHITNVYIQDNGSSLTLVLQNL